jgi:hypothetical protein
MSASDDTSWLDDVATPVAPPSDLQGPVGPQGLPRIPASTQTWRDNLARTLISDATADPMQPSIPLPPELARHEVKGAPDTSWLADVSTPSTDTSWLSDVSQPAGQDNGDQVSRGVANGALAEKQQPTFGERVAGAMLNPGDPWNPTKMAADVLSKVDYAKNMFVQAADFARKTTDIAQDLADQGKGTNNPLDNISQVLSTYRAEYGKVPVLDTEWGKLWPSMQAQAMKDPAGFVTDQIAGIINQPQFAGNPIEGVLGKAAGATGRVAESVTNLGVQGAAQSAVEQLHDTGTVSGTQAAQAGAMTAPLGLTALFHAMGAGVDAGLHSVDPHVDPAKVEAAQQKVADRVAAGMTPTEAYVKTMQEHGMDPTKAEEVGDVIERAQMGDWVHERMGMPRTGMEFDVDPETGVGINKPYTEHETPEQAPSPQGQAGDITPDWRAQDVNNKLDRAEAMRKEVPDADGNVAPQVYQNESFYHGPEGLTELPPDALTYPTIDRARFAARDVEGPKQDYLTETLPNGKTQFKDMPNPEGTTDIHGDVWNPVKEVMPETKVADANGDPLQVYHGTTTEYKKMASQYPDSATHFFSDNLKVSETYTGANNDLSGGHQPNIRPSYVDLKNPLIVDAKGKAWDAKLKTDLDSGHDAGLTHEAIYRARENGNDGVIIKNVRDSLTGEGPPSNVYVAFKDSQVKSAMGGQAGKIDPKLMISLGLASAAGMGVYTITGDKSKAVMAAAAAGMLPFAAGIVRRVGKGVGQITDAMKENRDIGTAVFDKNNGQRNVAIGAVKQWQRSVSALLKGEPNLKASFTRTRDYLQGYRDMGPLTPRETAYVNEVRSFLDMMGQKGLDEKVLRSTIEDYLPGLYQMKPFGSIQNFVDALTQNDAFRANYTGMSPKSRFALQKIFPDYRAVEAMNASGKFKAVPLTNDPAAMAAMYAHSLNKTIANKNLIETLLKTQSKDQWTNQRGEAIVKDNGDRIPIPLVVKDTPIDVQAAMEHANATRLAAMGIEDPAAVAIQNAADVRRSTQDYVPINHPILQGMRVHQAIAAPMQMLFDTHPEGPVTKALQAVSMGNKTLLFTASTMHGSALAQVAGPLMAAAGAGAMTLRAPFRMLGGIKEARQALFSNNGLSPLETRARQAGLMLDHGSMGVEDANPGVLLNTLNLMRVWSQGSLGPIGEAVSQIPRAMAATVSVVNHAIFQYIQPTLKLGTFAAAAARNDALIAKGTAKIMDAALADKQIAKAANDLYGGQNWFNLVNDIDNNVGRNFAAAIFSPNGRRWQQIIALSPDWNVSAYNAWHQAFKSMLPGVDPKASDFLYRTYLVSAGLTAAAAMNAVQRQFTGEDIWDKKDWTSIDTGDGTKMTGFKHLMEPLHALSNPQGFFMGKLGFIPSELADQLMGKEYVTYQPGQGGKDAYLGPNMADPSIEGRVLHALKHYATPIIAEDAVGGKETAARALSQLGGFPIRGSTYEEREQKAADTAEAKGKDPDRAVANVQKYEQKDEEARQANRDKRAARGF